MEEYKDSTHDVSITNLTDSWSCLGVAGPRSQQLLSSMFGEEHFTGREWPLLSHDVLSANGIEVRVMRISYTGETTSKHFSKPSSIFSVCENRVAFTNRILCV